MPDQSIDSSNVVIEDLLNKRAEEFEKYTHSDMIAFHGLLHVGVDDIIREAIEKIESKNNTVSFILESSGGYLFPTERIAGTLRHHYEVVNFFVPNFAMSAGTVLVMSGDEIFMDHYSRLGPIDPQVQTPDGNTVSAIGYIKEYDDLIEKSRKGDLTSAEAAFLLNKFDPGTLYYYRQEKELAVSLMQDWLVKYKFKNWKETETRHTKVDDQLRAERAKEIADTLNNPDIWHSHSRGISKDVLEERVNLRIKDISKDTDLDKRTKEYCRLLKDYQHRRGSDIVLHTRNGYNKWRM